MERIKVIDSIMGSGKTSYIINMINADTSRRYIYIAPYLDQVKRIKEKCPGFVEPDDDGDYVKLQHFNKLIAQGKNIASTHQLFKRATEETLNNLRDKGYTLIVDEVMEVVSHEEINKQDLQDAQQLRYVKIESDTGYLVWQKEEYKGTAFSKMMQLTKLKSIVVVEDKVFVWVFPAVIFQYFEEVYICTYMFEYQIQKYYFDLTKIDYEYYRIIGEGKEYKLIPHDGRKVDTSTYQISIYSGNKNNIGKYKPDEDIVDTYVPDKKKIDLNALSYNWYDNRSTKQQIDRLRKDIAGYFKNETQSASARNLWTAPKGHKEKLEGKGYKEGFLASNARATNDHKHRDCVAYLINSFINVNVRNFFKINKIVITDREQEGYSLSELLQFVFRSAIREGNPINLYIPSARMRYLLQDWLGLPRKD